MNTYKIKYIHNQTTGVVWRVAIKADTPAEARQHVLKRYPQRQIISTRKATT